MVTEKPQAHELWLTEYPSATLKPENLAVVETRIPNLGPGMALIQNLYLTPDPELTVRRVRTWPLRTALKAGPAVGLVIASRDAKLPKGTLVRHEGGWGTYTVLGHGQYDLCTTSEHIPPQAYLGVLGQPGLLACAGVWELADVRAGETVLITPATGPFGTAAARLARLRGAARIIGCQNTTTGTGEPAVDFDIVIHHQPADLSKRLLAAAPRGIHAAILGAAPNLFVDVLGAIAERGRVAWTADTGIPAEAMTDGHLPAADLATILQRGIRVIGYRASHFQHLRDRVEGLLAPELTAGRLTTGPATRRHLADLPEELANTANGSPHRTDIYQIAVP
ncbi:hypothetical protein KGQ20_08135 [Catenulispora sp. NF23]|uniref:hypothetical protein n=1 Tax=Catenulispora pinistramenti TaxID=2705254 RepID=UPI001BAA824B|nr:hypothetical protein [Catenulispora pinistramenti]MBS2532741.1 hypothetical protein [Catenulispora pinistramenti]